MISLASAVRNALLSSSEVGRLTSLRRSTSLFSQGQVAESIYFLDDGLVKLTRNDGTGSRIILGIRGPGHLVGEEALTADTPVYHTEAEILSTATAYRIPREVVTRAIASDADFASALVNYLLDRRLALAEKVELLCLHDVEYRILHYLAELSAVVKPFDGSEGYQLPITQLELADLIGATRETTSTTLNQLERRGLVQLSRRMLTVPSPGTLRDAALAKISSESASASAV